MHPVEVIDADGHGGEFSNWREKVPAQWQPRLAEYRDRVAKHYSKLVLPGGGTKRPATSSICGRA